MTADGFTRLLSRTHFERYQSLKSASTLSLNYPHIYFQIIYTIQMVSIKQSQKHSFWKFCYYFNQYGTPFEQIFLIICHLYTVHKGNFIFNFRFGSPFGIPYFYDLTHYSVKAVPPESRRFRKS
jgi:hypothetical protein